MGDYSASASMRREDSRLKPPILVRKKKRTVPQYPCPQIPEGLPAHMLIRWRRNAILSLYHIRPVPEEVDGRTDAAREEAGAPFRSVWLDENKPGMYAAAAELRQLGFRSRDTTLAILDQCKPAHPILSPN